MQISDSIPDRCTHFESWTKMISVNGTIEFLFPERHNPSCRPPKMFPIPSQRPTWKKMSLGRWTEHFGMANSALIWIFSLRKSSQKYPAGLQFGEVCRRVFGRKAESQVAQGDTQRRQSQLIYSDYKFACSNFNDFNHSHLFVERARSKPSVWTSQQISCFGKR